MFVNPKLKENLIKNNINIAYLINIYLANKNLFLTTLDNDIILNNEIIYKSSVNVNDIIFETLDKIDSTIQIIINKDKLLTDNQIDNIVNILNCRIDISIFDISAPDNCTIIYRGYICNYQDNGNNDISLSIISLMKKLINPIGNFYSQTCRASLGDHECKFNLNNVKFTGTAREILSTDCFIGDHQKQIADYFKFGMIKFTTGLNKDQIYSIKYENNGTIYCFSSFKSEVQNNDSYEIYAGCNKSFNTCKNKFNNVINFQGEPFIK